MSAPIIWILIPGLAAISLYILGRWERATHIAAIAVALLLALLAWQLPIGENIPLRLWPSQPALRVDEAVVVLGRPLVVDNTTRPMLILVYLGVGFWLGGALAANVNRLFIPMSLALAAMLVTAQAIEPAQLSILFIEALALTSVPILAPPGRSAPQGVIRFLAFQTIGVCLILVGDWLLPIAEITPDDTTQAIQAAILMGLGFALVDAIFPFHAWVPMLAEKVNPYAAAFFLSIFPMAIAFISLDYLAEFAQLSISPLVHSSLRTGGALVILLAGVWAAFQSHLGRIMGYAAITQIGAILLVFSLGSEAGYDPLFRGIFFAHLLPQTLGLAVWGFALRTIQERTPNLHFSSVQGLARRFPIATIGVVLSNLSLAGLPLLASFPISVALWTALTENSLGAGLVTLAGYACLSIAGLRSLAVLAIGSAEMKWQISEKRLHLALIALGCLGLIIIGLIPQLFLPPLVTMAFRYTAPGP